MALIRSRRTPRFLLAGSNFPPVPGFEEIENRMQKLLESTVPVNGDLFAQPIGWMPATDIIESEKELTLTAELPGLELKDIDISVDDGVLTVRGEKAEEKVEKEEEKRYHLFERTYGAFQRSFTLPRSVDPTKISAEFVKGVLAVHMPKTAEAKAKGRKIEVVEKK